MTKITKSSVTVIYIYIVTSISDNTKYMAVAVTIFTNSDVIFGEQFDSYMNSSTVRALLIGLISIQL